MEGELERPSTKEMNMATGSVFLLLINCTCSTQAKLGESKGIGKFKLMSPFSFISVEKKEK